MPNYAPRVSLPYNDMSGVIAVWSQSCSSMVVYEHEADVDVPTTHVHMIMIDCKYKTAEAMKRIFYELVPTTRKGNELWSWHHQKFPNPNLTFITYMTHGVKRPSYVNNVTEQEIEEYRALWVDDSKTPGNSSEPPPPKLTKYQIVKAVQAWFDAKAEKDLFGKPIAYQIEDESILQCIRRILIDNQQALGLYRVMDIYDGYIMYANKQKFIYNCLNVLEKRQPRI